eukprot:197912-Rhodomonas_salina.1
MRIALQNSRTASCDMRNRAVERSVRRWHTRSSTQPTAPQSRCGVFFWPCIPHIRTGTTKRTARKILFCFSVGTMTMHYDRLLAWTLWLCDGHAGGGSLVWSGRLVFERDGWPRCVLRRR